MSRVPAVGCVSPLPLDDPGALVDVEIEIGEPGFARPAGRRPGAVSVDPVDATVRQSCELGDEPTVLGFDAAGAVLAAGLASDVTGWSPVRNGG